MLEKIQILIPAHNAEKYLLDTFESIKAQTYEEVETVVIDNCSTDRTVALATSLGATVIKNENNIGRIGNWNKALEVFEEGSCNYAKIIFAGDSIERRCLEEQINVIREGAEIVSCAHAVRIGAGSDYVMNHAKGLDKLVLTGKCALGLSLESGNWFAGTTACVLFSKKSIEGKKFDATMEWASDWKFWADIVSKHGITYLSEPLAVFNFSARQGYKRLEGTKRAELEEKKVREYIRNVLME